MDIILTVPVISYNSILVYYLEGNILNVTLHFRNKIIVLTIFFEIEMNYHDTADTVLIYQIFKKKINHFMTSYNPFV